MSTAELPQGSVVTYLSYHGINSKDRAANLLLNPTVKEFLKLVNICQSYA